MEFFHLNSVLQKVLKLYITEVELEVQDTNKEIVLAVTALPVAAVNAVLSVNALLLLAVISLTDSYSAVRQLLE